MEQSALAEAWHETVQEQNEQDKNFPEPGNRYEYFGETAISGSISISRNVAIMVEYLWIDANNDA